MAASFIDQVASRLTTTAGAATAAAVAIIAAVALSASPGADAPARLVSTASAETPKTATPIDPKLVSPEQRKAIEQIVREYLLTHPEILMDVSKELEQRQQAMQAVQQRQVLLDRKASIFRAPTDYVFGNPKGDITVVEFFDYNCGWCKRAVDELNKLTKADPNLRVVLKELPIFGENSTMAAKAAMASISQGKYWDYHVALMKERQVTKDNIFKIAEKVGIDVARLKKDMEDPKFDAALKETTELAQALGIEGTPGFIVDAKVNVGFLPADGIKDLVAKARKDGCQVC